MPDKKKTMVKVPKKSTTTAETSSENRFELTKQYSDAQDKMIANANTDKGKSFTEKAQGITIAKEDLSAKPKLFKRKVITSGSENGTTKILGDDGTTVKYEGRSNMQATKDAVSQNAKQSADTNSRRESNSNYFNVNSGAKTELDKKDKDTLVRNGKAIVTKK